MNIYRNKSITKNENSEKPKIKCYNRNKFGHLSTACKFRESKSNSTNWRKKDSDQFNYALADTKETEQNDSE